LGIPFGSEQVPNIIIFVILIIIAFVPLLFGRTITVVNEKEVKVSFGYLGWFKKRIPLSDIQQVEVVSYKPLIQFGGWGIKSGKFRGEKVGCYSLKGNKGVLLTLSSDTRVCISKTKKLIIGSQMPEKLFDALVKQGI